MDPRFDVELVAVTKRYGATVAVDAISLRMPTAGYCCLLGPSGCGKTTTLRMIAGHEGITEGDILIDDRNVTDLPPTRARHGHDVPELRAVPASQLPRQCRLQPEDARGRQGRAASARARVPRPGADGATTPRGCRRSCRADSSSASRWRAR